MIRVTNEFLASTPHSKAAWMGIGALDDQQLTLPFDEWHLKRVTLTYGDIGFKRFQLFIGSRPLHGKPAPIGAKQVPSQIDKVRQTGKGPRNDMRITTLRWLEGLDSSLHRNHVGD